MFKDLKVHIEAALGLKITSVVPVSGGDISTALKVTTERDRFFCKYQAGNEGYPMLKAEKEGLEALAGSGCIKTPEVILLTKMEEGGCLLLEYIESKGPVEKDMIQFGGQLAELHAVHAESFGWKSDNYIGSLPQYNAPDESWPGFYALSRLTPQLTLAEQKGFLSKNEIPSVETMEKVLQKICQASEPSLVHGDLWGGNYLIVQDGTPCLIDPSVSYSNPGIDIAMTRLFGGFSSSFYEAYREASKIPIPDQAETELYQLYYLLVHLNIFGASYGPSVRGIMRRYF